jgi:hypothetical protein
VFSNTHMCAGLYTPAAPRQPDGTMSRRRNGKTYRPPDNIRAAGSVPKRFVWYTSRGSAMRQKHTGEVCRTTVCVMGSRPPSTVTAAEEFARLGLKV